MTAQQAQGPPLPEGDEQNKRVVQQVIVGMLALVVLVTILKWTSTYSDETPGPFTFEGQAKDGEQVANEQAANETPTSRPAAEAPPTVPYETRVSIETLADAQRGWLNIRTQSDPQQTSTGHGRYEADNTFRIETTNVDSFRIDLTQLPVLKNKKFIMHLDGQDMAAFPKKQGILTFSRTPNGNWFLEKAEQ